MSPELKAAVAAHADRIRADMARAGLLGDDAANIEASWVVGVRTIPILELLKDAEGRPVYQPGVRGKPALLCGIPCRLVEGEGIRLDACRKPRPTVMVYTDRIEDAAAAIRRAFASERLEALVRALGGCEAVAGSGSG
jgi:hypothetical protein